MASLKLGKLPDRTPVKLTINIMPDLQSALNEYTSLYAQEYGVTENVIDLIPSMLAGFLDSDREFQKARGIRSAAKP